MAIQYYADQDVKGNITLGGNLIFNTGGNALITTSGGDLTLSTSTDDIFLIAQDDISLAVNGGDVGVYISGGGGTSLRYNNSQKLITTNTGVSVEGKIANVTDPTLAQDAATKAYVDGGGGAGSGFLPLSAGGSYPLTGALYIPNYIYHNGDAGTHIGYPSVGRFTIATGNTTRADFTNAGFSLGDFQTNVSVSVILDEDNMGSNSATALVTQQSVKAYVDAHTSGIGGSGTTNSIPMFTAGTTIGNSAMSQANIGTGTAKRITVSGARMTITGNGADADGGTLNLSSSTARLGISLPSSVNGGEPEASLDVGNNARVRGSLNVGATNEQYLFVSTTGDTPVGYVRMSYYGQGADYDLSGDETTSVQYTTGFSNGGKICEDERIMTFKLTRSQIENLSTTPKTLISQNSNFNYIVKEAYMYQINNGGTSPVFGGSLALEYSSVTGGTTRADIAYTVSAANWNQSRTQKRVMFFDKSTSVSQVGTANVVPRSAVILKATSGITSAGSGDVNYFLRMRVKNIDIMDDIIMNSQLIVVT